MKTNAMLLVSLTLFSSFQVFAHGEDKAGPHNGFIRMPGAFHTEVVQASPSELQVYLLDIAWKNPSVQNSSVDVFFTSDKKNAVNCAPSAEKNLFTCPVPPEVDLSKLGKLIVKAKRDGQAGNDAVYELPLKLKKSHDSGHNSH